MLIYIGNRSLVAPSYSPRPSLLLGICSGSRVARICQEHDLNSTTARREGESRTFTSGAASEEKTRQVRVRQRCLLKLPLSPTILLSSLHAGSSSSIPPPPESC